MSITPEEILFIETMNSVLAQIWWDCSVRESHTKIPNTLAVVGDGLRMVTFNIDKNEAIIYEAGEYYFESWNSATFEVPIRVPIQSLTTALIKLAEENSVESVRRSLNPKFSTINDN